jgi:hypothetical protein
MVRDRRRIFEATRENHGSSCGDVIAELGP